MSYNFNADIDRNGKKKRPKCAKCRNHGLMVLRLGHKGCCQYDDCDCELCKQTKTRNDAMAKTMANERRRKKESGRASVSSTTSPVSEYPYPTSERTRTSFNLQLDAYNPTSGGNLGSYNVGRVANTMSYTSSSKNACNPFVSPMETKVFGSNSYHNFYHRAPQGFPTPTYKTEPDQRAAFLNPLNGFGAVTQPHLTMIGSTNK
ncbi:hypothetical protein ACHWQZ_G018236 [Mnemiopsis leidyi]